MPTHETMASRRTVLALCVLSFVLDRAAACIWLYGNAPDSMKPPTGYNFAFLGEDWEGTCANGTEQSPIDFPDGDMTGNLSKAARTNFSYPDFVSDGENLEVINTGVNIQVEWGNLSYNGEISVPHRGSPNSTVLDVLNFPAEVNNATAVGKPIQFHFHSSSEHTMGGTYYPLEMHIVNAIPEEQLPGCEEQCIAPVGVFFREVEQPDNPVLEQVFKYASPREGKATVVPQGERIDLSQLLPSGGNGTYLQYRGGLTTPPCTEGFLWHVFTQPSFVSRAQMDRFRELVSPKKCENKTAASNITVAAAPQNTTMSAPGGDAAANATAAPNVPLAVNGPAATNTTAPTTSRRLLSDRGLKRFMLPAQYFGGRSLLAESAEPSTEWTPSDDYVCTPAAFGQNNRRVQPLNGREITLYQ